MAQRTAEVSSQLHLYLGHLLASLVTVTFSCSRGQVPAQCLAMDIPCPCLRDRGVMGHWYEKTQHLSTLVNARLLGHV